MTFRLCNGKTAYLQSLHQWPTYSGVLEGFPSVKLNEMIISHLPGLAQHHTHCKHSYHIPPQRIKGNPDAPMGGEETMPATTCVIALRCNIPGQGHEELAVVWLQENLAPPFSPDLLRQIEILDWKQHAHFISYDEY